MTLEVRILTLGFAVFTAVSLLLALAVPLLLPRVAGVGAALRARRLARLRLLPTTAGAGAALLVVAAFLAFEPRRPGEYMGWVIPAFAMIGALTWLTAGWRSLRLAAATRRTVSAWLVHARPITLSGIEVPVLEIDSQFPVVAVIGLFRPKVVIAKSVLASCTPDELRAILAHEQGHVTRRDNLHRWLMSLAPDALAWLPASSRLFAAWRIAAEEAADDDAELAGAEGRVSLAAALVKVARLATTPLMPHAMPASALYCGEELDGRIRRLLQPVPTLETERRSRVRAMAWLVPACAMSILALEGLHAIIEVAIHALP